MKKLTNRVAVITGAGSGIGRALAKALAAEGCHLALVDIHTQGLEETQRELGQTGRTVTLHVANVMDRATLIRSAVQPDLGSILHSRHQYHWHTGYIPPQTVACPHLGTWMARVLGPEIRVNAVCPGMVDTKWLREGYGARYAAIEARYRNGTPLGRPGTPEEVAAVIVWLIEGADLITGDTIMIDGGMHMGLIPPKL